MTGYLRENGQIGIRDHLLALPSVVCSNRAALAAGQAVGGVWVEHPLGCAQIGADKEQTWRTLVGIGAHPNVRRTVVIGLGCEGVQAATIHQGILDRGREAAVYSIQTAGGTDQAAEMAAAALRNAPPADRVPLPPERLILGVEGLGLFGGRADPVVAAFREAGGRVVRALAPGETAPEGAVVIDYAEPVPDGVPEVFMRAGAGDSETITGLVASGCHLVLAPADAARIGGHPIAPVVRLGYDPALARALADDMDGMVDARTPDQWAAFLLSVADGTPTAAEEVGAALFAIERLGPTL
ncbi:MAG: UxaA family hydrolase [Actinomycetia bacterium]|nr:UxaA family hydrolase [Actinomycetes bacterium]